MARRVLPYFLLALVIAWLVLSYTSTSMVSLTQIPAPQNSAWFGPVALLILAVMVVIQVGLLGATSRFMRIYQEQQRNGSGLVANFHLKLTAELFWTLVPLIIVCILGLLSFSIWGAAWL